MKLNLMLAGPSALQPTHRIMDLCDFLTARVLEPALVRQGTRWDRRFSHFFKFDNTCDPLEPTGSIRFDVPPVLAGKTAEIESVIIRELAQEQITCGPFTYERNPLTGAVRAITIPIISNPTAQLMPPPVNMSQTRGCLVLRDLLGYQRVNGRYEFVAEDLLQRVSAITPEKIAACVASPVRDPEVQNQVRRKPSPSSIKSIGRCLNEIRQFAQWALNHHYNRLAAT